MGQLHIIPDWNHIQESLEIAETWDCVFEYNDFFDMKVVDDKEELHKRIKFYRELNRDRNKDTLHGAFYDLCIHSADSQIAELSQKRMRQSMEIAAGLQVRGVIFHTNMIPGFELGRYVDNWLNSNEAFLRQLIKKYRGIEIYMENMFDRTPYMLVQLAERMKAVKEFGVCFDVAHANISGTPMREWYTSLTPYVQHIHINDNDGRSDLHQPVGQGKIDWNEYKDWMLTSHLTSSVLIEVSTGRAAEESLLFMKEKGLYPFGQTVGNGDE